MLNAKYVLPFLSDGLGVTAFLLLVIRGHKSASTVLTERVFGMTNHHPTATKHAEMSNFVNDFLMASDMQRRTNLAALVSVGSALGLASDRAEQTILVPMLAGWLLFFYIASNWVTIGSDLSRANLLACRKKLVWLFVAWTLFSVAMKALGLLWQSSATTSPVLSGR